MLKKLDLLLLRSFIGPFAGAFFLTLFVLDMQFFWLYMDELIGKGLDTSLILQLLLYMTTTLVPLALPLAVLISAIMTFGNMGENFELVALKSSGISLNRFMRPLLIAIIALSAGALYFYDTVIPVSNLKAFSLLYDLRNSKPTLNIRPGIFNNDIPNYSIRVGRKDKDGITIRNIVIYDHTNGYGNNKLVLAQKGQMLTSKDGRMLVFRLQDGWRYEEGFNGPDRTQMRMHFGQWDKVFDLSGFKVNSTDQNLFTGDQKMMSLEQLSSQQDSIKKGLGRTIEMVRSYSGQHITALAPEPAPQQLATAMGKQTGQVRSYKNNFIENLPDSVREMAASIALSHARNTEQLVNLTATSVAADEDKMRRFEVEWHRKITMSAACILLFLIGAPMGAIIRKGGMGLPMVFAIAFFLIWYILSFAGEKLAATGATTPFLGMWGSTFILAPLAFFIINKARNDSPLFQKDAWLRLLGKLPLRRRKNKTQPAV